jgi:hypothetical protein
MSEAENERIFSIRKFIVGERGRTSKNELMAARTRLEMRAGNAVKQMKPGFSLHVEQIHLSLSTFSELTWVRTFARPRRDFLPGKKGIFQNSKSSFPALFSDSPEGILQLPLVLPLYLCRLRLFAFFLSA